MDLPPELRLQVYTHFFTDLATETSEMDRKILRSATFTLLHICRLIRNEAIPVLQDVTHMAIAEWQAAPKRLAPLLGRISLRFQVVMNSDGLLFQSQNLREMAGVVLAVVKGIPIITRSDLHRGGPRVRSGGGPLEVIGDFGNGDDGTDCGMSRTSEWY